MLKVYLLALFVFVVAQCGNDQAAVPPSQNPVDKDRAVDENLTDNIVNNDLEEITKTSQNLLVNVSKACSAEGFEVQTLREDWKKSMRVFHYLEAVPFGAFGAKPVPGCESRGELACRIYSWPYFTNEKAVKSQMRYAKSQGDKYRFRSDSESAIGLDAMEYILFETLRSEIKIDDSSEACPYLQLLAQDVASASDELFKAFEIQRAAELEGEQTEEKYKEKLDEIARSLSFFKQAFLYRKINRFLGLPGSSSEDPPFDCQDTCSEQVEHRWASLTKEALQWNLESFQQIYTGDVEGAGDAADGFGIKDYLEEANQKTASEFPLELSKKMLEVLNGFKSEEAFQQAILDFAGKDCEKEELCVFQENAFELAQWLTNDLLTLLSIDATGGGVQGDND